MIEVRTKSICIIRKQQLEYKTTSYYYQVHKVIFCEPGFENTTASLIAKEAGVSEGTVLKTTATSQKQFIDFS